MKKYIKLVLIVAALAAASAPIAQAQDSGDLWSNIDPSDHSYDNLYNPQLTLEQQALMFWAHWGYFILFGS